MTMVPHHKWRSRCAWTVMSAALSIAALGCGRREASPPGTVPAEESAGDEAEILPVNWLTAHQSAAGGSSAGTDPGGVASRLPQPGAAIDSVTRTAAHAHLKRRLCRGTMVMLGAENGGQAIRFA